MNSLLKTSFGLVAKEYQKYRRSYDARLFRLLFSLFGAAKTDKTYSILDIGCGTGKSTEPIFVARGKRKISVVGVDPDKAMLHEARLSAHKKKLPITYISGSAEKLPFPDDTFDAAIAGAAFHWFANKRAFRSIKKVLKKDGLFFVFWVQYVKTNKPAIGNSVYDKFNFKGIPKNLRSQASVGKILRGAGFKKVQTVVVPFTEKRTIVQTIGLWKTNSSYTLLSKKDRKNFVKEMTVAYQAALGKKKFDVNKMELRVCYGFK